MSRKSRLVNLAILTVTLVLTGKTALAFHDDETIDDIRLFDESFVDINAGAFRKSLNLEWLDTLSGWRMGGGSTSTDYLFLQTHLKLHHQLSEKFYFGLDLEQDDFYTRKPLEAPLLFADVYPFASSDIGFSFLGTAAVDKRQSDLGFALTIGRRPRNYVRLSWLSVDHYFNEKNPIDDAYYQQSAERMVLQGSYNVTDHWDVHFDLEKETPSEFVFDDQISRFNNESYNYRLSIIYHFNRNQFAGADVRAMNVEKSLLEATGDEAQEVDYHLADIYWVNGVGGDYELTAGLRYDDFTEEFRDQLNQANSYNFQLWTLQAYSTLCHDYSTHQAWDLGLYVGWSERDKIYVVAGNPNEMNEGIQAKLRTSWEYHSADKRSRLLLSFSLNLDDLIDDPTDGGGMYFQTLF
jgi:hypothetical protein